MFILSLDHVKKIDVSHLDFFQKGGGQFLLFTIFTISYLLAYYEYQATITFTGAADTHSTCYNCMSHISGQTSNLGLCHVTVE